MLVTPHTLLARSRRQKNALAWLQVTSIEMLQAVLSQADQSQTACGIIIPSTIQTALDTFIYTSMIEAARARSKVALVVRVPADSKEVEVVVAAGAPALLVEYKGSDSFDTIRQSSEAIVATAHLQHKDVIVQLARPMTFAQLEILAHEVHMQAMVLPRLYSGRDKKGLSLTQLKEISTITRLPLLLSEESLTRHWLKKASLAGVDGFIIDGPLEQAFLAGARSGIYDKNASTSQFQRFTTKAIQKRVESYFTLFKEGGNV